MMGAENHDGEETHPLSFKEAMENVVLDDPLPPLSFLSYSDYGSSIPSVNDVHHPLSSPKHMRSSADNAFLEPPSYAEAVCGDEHDVANNGYHAALGNSSGLLGSSSSSSANSGSSPEEYLRITVSNPQKEQEMTNSLVPGVNSSYITYLITTRTNMTEFGNSEFAVRRRFRDVVTLAVRLAESYRGFLIPPRPDKNVMESQVMHRLEFVEQRRAALEKYLRRLAAHPAIRRSDEFRLFLQSHGNLPFASNSDSASTMLDVGEKLPRQLRESVHAVSAEDVSGLAEGGRDLFRIFKVLKQSVVNDWGGSRPPVVEDKEFWEKKEKLKDLEQQLINASQQAEGLVKAQQDIGDTMGELGLAFIKLAKFETEKGTLCSQRRRAADSRRLATAALKASRLYRDSNAQSVKHLDKLHEYLGLMQAVHSAFSDRSNALLTVQTLSSELSSMNSRAEKLEAAFSNVFGGDRARNQKLEELKEAIKVTEERKSFALKEYERIKENNKNELERLERERTSDFFGMLSGFVVNQAALAEKIANVWEQVVEDTSEYAKEELRFVL